MCNRRRTAKSCRWIRRQSSSGRPMTIRCCTSQRRRDLARARRCLHRSMDGGGRSAGDMGIVDGETILVIHDDANANADTDTVTKEAVSAIREVVRHIGKVDRRYDEGQLAEIEKAFRWLQAALTSKKFTNAHRTKRREAPRRRERPCRHDRAPRMAVRLSGSIRGSWPSSRRCVAPARAIQT